MATIWIDSDRDNELRRLVQAAISGEIARMEIGLDLARQRLQPFEEKYGVSSEHFMTEMTAEDLTGGDDEYVHWAGEYMLWQRLNQKLQQLKDVKYGD